MKTYQLIETKTMTSVDSIEASNREYTGLFLLSSFYFLMCVVASVIIFKKSRGFYKSFLIFPSLAAILFLYLSVICAFKYFSSDEEKIQAKEEMYLKNGWVIVNEK